MAPSRLCPLLLLLSLAVMCAGVVGDDNRPKAGKKKKDIRDYNDADMARLLEEWEVTLSVGWVGWCGPLHYTTGRRPRALPNPDLCV